MTDLAIHADAASAMERVVATGDLSKLSSSERIALFRATCESLGLNPLTRPFDFLTFQGRTVLYVKKDATDQLRRIHKVSVQITSREQIGDVFIVTARASMPDGRTDESIGAIPIKGCSGDRLANAFMKTETKAKRRVTLSICGLGLLDESEIDTMPGAQPQHFDPQREQAIGALRHGIAECDSAEELNSWYENSADAIEDLTENEALGLRVDYKAARARLSGPPPAKAKRRRKKAPTPEPGYEYDGSTGEMVPMPGLDG